MRIFISHHAEEPELGERLEVSLRGEGHRLYYMPAGQDKEEELAEDVAMFDQWDARWVLRREIYKQKSWLLQTLSRQWLLTGPTGRLSAYKKHWMKYQGKKERCMSLLL